jgi:hypothetical protein
MEDIKKEIVPDMKKALTALRFAGRSFEDNMLLPKNACYTDQMNGFDGRPAMRESFSKLAGIDLAKTSFGIAALSSGTTDLSLIPIYVDPTIVDQTRRLTPLVELLPRVTNYGRTADFNYMSARGVVGWRAENPALDAANDTYTRQSKAKKYCYQVGNVTGPFLAASRQYLSNQYIDALNLEVRNKTISMRYIEEDSLLNGTAAARTTSTTGRPTYGGTYAAGDEPVGMIDTITTNTEAMSSKAVTIAYLREMVRQARTAGSSTTLGQGDPNLMVTDFKTLDDTKSLLQDYQRYINTDFTIAWGLKTLEFEGVPMIASKFAYDVTAYRNILCLDMSTWQASVLQDITYEELAKTTDAYKFMLKMYETFICTAEMFNSKKTGWV